MGPELDKQFLKMRSRVDKDFKKWDVKVLEPHHPL